MPQSDRSGGVRFEGSHIEGNVLGQGVQINVSGPRPRTVVPSTPAERRRAAGHAIRQDVITFVCRGAWLVCLATAHFGMLAFAWRARVTGFADTLTEGRSVIFAPAVLAGWCLDLLFFRLRSRWEAPWFSSRKTATRAKR